MVTLGGIDYHFMCELIKRYNYGRDFAYFIVLLLIK